MESNNVKEVATIRGTFFLFMIKVTLYRVDCFSIPLPLLSYLLINEAVIYIGYQNINSIPA